MRPNPSCNWELESKSKPRFSGKANHTFVDYLKPTEIIKIFRQIWVRKWGLAPPTMRRVLENVVEWTLDGTWAALPHKLHSLWTESKCRVWVRAPQRSSCWVGAKIKDRCSESTPHTPGERVQVWKLLSHCSALKGTKIKVSYFPRHKQVIKFSV